MRTRQDVLHRARAHLAEPLVLSGYSLIVSTGLGGVLGVVFWAVAARVFTPSEVGTDGVLITVMITLSSVCQLNMGNALLRFLPQTGDRAGRTVLRAYGIASLAAVLGGIVFVAAAPSISESLAFLTDSVWLPFAFVAAVVLWGIFALEDAALTALRCAPWLPAENSAFGIAKIAALPVALALGISNGVFAAWVVPLLVIVPVMNWLLFRRAIGAHLAASHAPPERRFERRALVRFIATDYLGSVFGQATITLIPLVVLHALGSRLTGFFYIPFAVISAFDSLFYGVTTSLVAEAARDEPRRRELTHLVVRRFLAFHVPAALLIVVVAPLVLLPFGADYAHQGTTLLRLLALASCFRAVVVLYAAVCRVEGRSGRLAVVEAALLVTLVPGVAILANSHGLNGVGVAWLIGNALVALAVAAPLLRFLRREQRPGPGAGQRQPA
ncbi:MAG TPA: hypothetical protein VII98_04090 [Solirubrobacteraceae bacterium]